MNALTLAFFEMRFELDFRSKNGNEFQDFFSEIMEKVYPGDFQRVRPWGNIGDQKNDGYLRSERRLFAVYAPNEVKAAETIAKIEEDFTGALPHWVDHFDNWVFVHNARNGLGPTVVSKLLEVGRQVDGLEVQQWGFAEIRPKVFSLPERDLIHLLGAVPSIQDVVDTELAPILEIVDMLSRLNANLDDISPPPANKIEINLLSESTALLLKTGMAKSPLLAKYFRDKQRLRDEIAQGLHARYEALKAKLLVPDIIFAKLNYQLAGDEPSVTKQVSVLAVLAYFFEGCDIFEREKK